MKDAAELQRELENERTANTALRVELYKTQQMLAAANAAVTTLAQGAAIAKQQHLDEVGLLMNQCADQLCELDDVKRDVAELKRRAGA